MASNDLSSLQEEGNTNSEEDPDNQTDEGPGNDTTDPEGLDNDTTDLEGLDNETILKESKKVSIFCRNCLSPYYGVKGQGGSIILKCTKCYHRDVITEDELQDTSLEHSESIAKGGNMILNRFSKILLENNELQKIDLEEQSVVNDELRELTEALPHITGIMKQTFIEMHRITDEHRKVHNADMLRMLRQAGQGEDLENVPTHGSNETNDLVILPELYKIPEDEMEKYRMFGRRGVQEADKYILNVGITMKQLGSIPLFQGRLLGYCKLARCSKYGPNSSNTQIIKSQDKVENNSPENKRNVDQDQSYNTAVDNNLTAAHSSSEQSTIAPTVVDTPLVDNNLTAEHSSSEQSTIAPTVVDKPSVDNNLTAEHSSSEQSTIAPTVVDKPSVDNNLTAAHSSNEQSTIAPTVVDKPFGTPIQDKMELSDESNLLADTEPPILPTDTEPPILPTDNISAGTESPIIPTDTEPPILPTDNISSDTEQPILPTYGLSQACSAPEMDELTSKIEEVTNLQNLSDRIQQIHKRKREKFIQQFEEYDNTKGDESDDETVDNINSHLQDEEREDSSDENDTTELEYLSELFNFSEFLQSTKEQKQLAEFIPKDIVLLKETNHFTYVEVREAFNEITTSMINRAAAAKIQRLRNTQSAIKRAARSMAEQVDQVQNEMIKELQMAYRAKQLKAEKQKKQLEEHQETLQHYRHLIAHYERTGDIARLFEVLQLIRDYNKQN
jgi:hypothetical protein